MTATDALLAPGREGEPYHVNGRTTVDWLIDNAEMYGRLLQSLRGARRSVRIAQLAFDADCAAYAGGSLSAAHAGDEVIAELLIELAQDRGAEIRILLNASWILNTARPLGKYFAARGLSREQVEVRGLSRFPHFMHAKLVLVDENEAFLLGSPFVNSYWDDGGHSPCDERRPLRELGGRPLHDVSVHLRGAAVCDLESLFENVWNAAGTERPAVPLAPAKERAAVPRRGASAVRVIADAPDGVLPNVPDGATHMLSELLAGIARARTFIYIEHQYLTSRPIVAAISAALRREPALEIIIVLNQNPDLTAYRGWQNAQLRSNALLRHPRVGIFTLWSTDADPARAGVTRINQLFIHSKVIVVDDEWAAVGTSNLDGVSMGNYGDDFSGALGKRVFRGVRNVEVNVVLDARLSAEEVEQIVALRERLWCEHLGIPREELDVRADGGWLATWRSAARENVRTLASAEKGTPRMVGRLLPYSERAFPREQLADIGVHVDPARLSLCYDPTWIGVHLSAHWILNIF